MKRFCSFILSVLLLAALAVPASAHGPHHGQNSGHRAQACQNGSPSCNYALPDWAVDADVPGTNGVIAKKIWASEDADGNAYALPDWAAGYQVCLHGDDPPCSTAGQSGLCGGDDSRSHLVTSIFSPIFNHICCIR